MNDEYIERRTDLLAEGIQRAVETAKKRNKQYDNVFMPRSAGRRRDLRRRTR